jgi:hypothetical protein
MSPRLHLRALAFLALATGLAAAPAPAKKPVALQVRPPQPPARGVELHLYMLFGSRAAGEDAVLPDPVQGLAAGLKATLNLRSLAPAATLFQRAADPTFNLNGLALTAPLVGKNPDGTPFATPLRIEWNVGALRLDGAPGSARVALAGFRIVAWRGGETMAVISTDLNLGSAEKALVGAANLTPERMLVVVAVAKVLD